MTPPKTAESDLEWQSGAGASASRPPAPALRVPQWLVRPLVEAPRWLLVISLVFAPWAYGSTRLWAVHVLDVLLGLTCLLWAGECLLRRRRPLIPLLPLLAAGFLLVQGWWMVVNAQWVYHPQTDTLSLQEQWVRGAPGSLERHLSLETMWTVTGLLGVLLFCCDLSQRAIWRRRLWLTLGLTGVSIAAFGIILKIGGLPAMAWIWEPEKRDLANNFAAYRYRANAGAFLNIVFPVIVGLACVTFQRRRREGMKALWVAALILLGVALQLSASRATWGIAILLAVPLLWRAARQYLRGHLHQNRALMAWTYGAVAALLLAGVAGIALLGGWETGWKRISAFGVDPSARCPREVYWTMAREASWAGFGPGTFRAAFPYYQENYDFGGRDVPEYWINGYWENAHHDYLQTLIEWGYAGGFCWALLFFGGVAIAGWRVWRGKLDSASQWLLFGGALAVGGTLVHALVDFPLQVASIQLYLAVLLGLCWAPVFSSKTSATPRRSGC